MKSFQNWVFLGALISLTSCKSDPPAAKVTAESANAKPSTAPSASAVASATTATPVYGQDDLLADIEYCSQFWLSGIHKSGGRCDNVEPLWAEGGVEAAVAKYKAGCDNKDGKSCLLLVGALSHPKSPMQSKDKLAYIMDASALVVKACEFGDPNSCYIVASHYICADDDGSDDRLKLVCTPPIKKFTKGKKPADFAALLEPGCTKGLAASCRMRAERLMAVKGEVDEVTDLFKRACDLGDASGCGQAARIAKKFGFDADVRALEAKEFSLHETQCRRFDDCTALGGHYSADENDADRLRRIRELLTQYCVKPLAWDTSCLVLAKMQVKGAGGPVDGAAAAPRLEALCNKPIDPDDSAMALEPTSVACQILSHLYRDGTGVAKDEAKAKALMKRACIERDPSSTVIDAACKELKEMGK